TTARSCVILPPLIRHAAAAVRRRQRRVLTLRAGSAADRRAILDLGVDRHATAAVLWLQRGRLPFGTGLTADRRAVHLGFLAGHRRLIAVPARGAGAERQDSRHDRQLHHPFHTPSFRVA